MLGKVIYKTIILIVFTLIFFLVIDRNLVSAQTLTSPTYQLIDPSINSGGNALQSTASFKLFETIGDVDSDKFTSATYSLGGGLVNSIVMTAPQITAAQPGGGDPGTVCGGVGTIGDPAYGCYDKLKVTLASDGNPTDTLYAIEVTEASDTNWTNKKYVNFSTLVRDASLSTNTFATLSAINALSYSVGSLVANTSYKFRSFAIQIANSSSFPSGGTYFDQSPYSQVSSVSTKLPGIGLDIDIAANSTTPSSAPYTVSLGALSSSGATTSPTAQGIWVKISTNANSGLTLSVNDSSNGLVDGAKIIGSADSSFNNTADLSTSIVGFGKVLRTGGNITNQGVGPAGITQTISSNYNNFGTDTVGKLATGIVTLASTNKPNTLIVSGYDLKARILSTTPAGSYTDTITYTLAGSFKSANFVKDKYYLTALVNKMNLKKIVSIGLCFFIIVSILPISFVHGATVAVTVTPSAVVDGDTTNKEVLFLPSTALINNSKLYVYYPSSYTDTSLVSGDVTVTKNTPSSDPNYTSASTSVDTTNNVLTITLTTSGTLDTTNSIKVVIAGAKLVASSTGGSPAGVNHSFGIATDNLSGGGDIGASLQYVGSLNKVQVTAIVPPVLTFAIRNSADSAEQGAVGTQKVCNLGVLSLTAVSSCAYRLKVTTNANSGYTISYNSDTRLYNGSYNFTDSAIGSPGTTLAAGTEMYGVILTKGAISSGASVTRNSTKFSTDPDAAKSFRITEAAGPYLVLTAAGYNAPGGTDTTNTTLMTHQAAISGVTPTGSYSHIVTYTVAATF